MHRYSETDDGKFGRKRTAVRDGESGLILIGLLVTMAVFSILGAALLPITATAIFNQLGANSSQKAYYLAEGGYRYAASSYLHGGAAESSRDEALAALHNQSFALADGYGSFRLAGYPYYYKTRAAHAAGAASLQTKIPGGLGVTIPPAGKIMVGGAVYDYASVVVAGETAENPPFVTFNALTPGLVQDIPPGATVLPVALASSQELTRGGDLSLGSGTETIFPSYRGTFRVGTEATVYSYERKAGSALQGVRNFENPGAAISLSIAADTPVVLLKYLELHSEGTVGSGFMRSARKVIYRSPIAGIESDQSGAGGPSTLVADSFTSFENWLPPSTPSEQKTFGAFVIDNRPDPAVPGGGPAVLVQDVGTGGQAKGILPSNPIRNNLAALWWNSAAALEDKTLSYDVQVKVAQNAANFVAGTYVRFFSRANVQGGLGISFVEGHLKANKFPIKLLPPGSADGQNYLVLWIDPGGGQDNLFQLVAYSPLPAWVQWPTLLVRINERKLVAPTGGFAAGERVNEIRVFYSTPDPTGTGVLGASAVDDTRLGNPRGSFYWPPGAGQTSFENDRFTLVSWTMGPGFPNANYAVDGTIDGLNTLLRSNDPMFLTTPANGYDLVDFDPDNPATYDDFPPEIGLHAFGADAAGKVWFDDFAIGSGPFGGSQGTIGFLPPIQE